MPGVILESSEYRLWEERSGAIPGVVCSARWPGVELFIREQNLSNVSTWGLKNSAHSVIVLLSGAVDRLETEVKGSVTPQDQLIPGEVWTFPAQEQYAGLAQGKVIRFADLFLDPGAVEEVTGRSFDLPSIQPRLGHYDDFLYKSIKQMESLIQQPDDLAAMLAQSLSHSVYMHVFREYTDQPQISVRRSHCASELSSQEKKILNQYIEEHLGRSISLHQLAMLISMKIHPFLEAFRESYGTTPTQYIIEQRLRRARLLLATTKRDITSIALDTGFSNHSHLTNAFRTRLGVTPKEFRAAHR